MKNGTAVFIIITVLVLLAKSKAKQVGASEEEATAPVPVRALNPPEGELPPELEWYWDGSQWKTRPKSSMGGITPYKSVIE